MTEPARGYISDVAYVRTFMKELAPAWLDHVALFRGFGPPARAKEFSWCELGCGQGITPVIVAAPYSRGRFYGIDAMPPHIEQARRFGRIRLSQLQHIARLVADLALHQILLKFGEAASGDSIARITAAIGFAPTLVDAGAPALVGTALKLSRRTISTTSRTNIWRRTQRRCSSRRFAAEPRPSVSPLLAAPISSRTMTDSSFAPRPARRSKASKMRICASWRAIASRTRPFARTSSRATHGGLMTSGGRVDFSMASSCSPGHPPRSLSAPRPAWNPQIRQ